MASPHGPNVENLRKQAKALLRGWQQGDFSGRARVAAFFQDSRRPRLQSAQFVLAREYGFRTWTALLDFVPRMGHFDDIATFRIAREFDVPRERLWKAISEPDEIGTWLLPVSFESTVGARYALRSQPSMAGYLGEYHHQHAIRFDSIDGAFWRFSIEPSEGDGAPLHVHHRRGPHDPRVRPTVPWRRNQGMEP